MRGIVYHTLYSTDEELRKALFYDHVHCAVPMHHMYTDTLINWIRHYAHQVGVWACMHAPCGWVCPFVTYCLQQLLRAAACLQRQGSAVVDTLALPEGLVKCILRHMHAPQVHLVWRPARDAKVTDALHAWMCYHHAVPMGTVRTLGVCMQRRNGSMQPRARCRWSMPSTAWRGAATLNPKNAVNPFPPGPQPQSATCTSPS
jgi:hypothetical protein